MSSNTIAKRNARSNFRFRKDQAHFTFACHLEAEKVIAFFREKGHGLKWYSFVNETSEEGHTHCHFACQFERQIDTTNPRYFDLPSTIAEGNMGHPNLQHITNREHAIRIFDEYHKKDGTPVQSTERPGSALSLIQQCLNAPTLFEACAVFGIEPTTVGDIKALRMDKAKPGRYVHKYKFSASWSEEAEKIPTDFRVLFLSGPTATGKTQWAVSQFDNPLLVSQRDDFRNFVPGEHDGIVLDDMSFREWSRTECIHLLDWDEDRTINCRYTNATIPAKTRKIITSNLSWFNVFPDDESKAIVRRISHFHKVSGPLFAVANVTVPESEIEEFYLPTPPVVGVYSNIFNPYFAPEETNQEITYNRNIFLGLSPTAVGAEELMDDNVYNYDDLLA